MGVDRYYLKGPSSIFHTGAGLAIACLSFGFSVFPRCKNFLTKSIFCGVFTEIMNSEGSFFLLNGLFLPSSFSLGFLSFLGSKVRSSQLGQRTKVSFLSSIA